MRRPNVITSMVQRLSDLRPSAAAGSVPQQAVSPASPPVPAPVRGRARLSVTLTGYTARNYLVWVVAVLSVVIFIIGLIELVELLRRSDGEQVPFTTVLSLAAMRIPFFILQVAPILILIASIGCCWWMTRSHEFTVARATGLSFWQFYMPIAGIALLFGAGLTFGGSLLSAQLLELYDETSGGIWQSRSAGTVLKLSSTGIWLQEELPGGGIRFVRARGVRQSSPERTELATVDLTELNPEGSAMTRSWRAASAVLAAGDLSLTGLSDVTDPDNPAPLSDRSLPTRLVVEASDVAQGRPAEEADVYSLRRQVLALRAAGKPAFKIEAWYQKLLALPVACALMALIAAIFALRPPRKGYVGVLIAVCIAIALTYHLSTDVILTLGLAGTLPVLLAVWGPVAASGSVAVALLLMLEDG